MLLGSPQTIYPLIVSPRHALSCSGLGIPSYNASVSHYDVALFVNELYGELAAWAAALSMVGATCTPRCSDAP